jgi:transcriptional regulator with GAF, ATPase, and Fis domain
MTKQDKQNSLFELAGLLTQQRDFDEILRLVSQKAAALFNADISSVIMINPNTQHTRKTVMREGGNIDDQQHKLLQTNIAGWVNKNEKIFSSNDVKSDSRFRKDLFSGCDAKAALCAPLLYKGVMMGFLSLLNANEKIFEENDMQLFEKFALICAPFLANTPHIEDCFHTVLPEAALVKKYHALGLLGKSAAFVELLKAIESAAHCGVRVLLEGKSGTGKELVARAIHENSGRSQFPFVAVDCGAIPENLVESELFGHTRGAFTGATQDRKGIFEEANLGSLFIDEIENLPLNMQSKLLRVVQEGEIRVVGSNGVRKVDVRIIAASSNSLHLMVERGAFREDLYYRLYVYPISVPTLNERRDDIPLLTKHFIARFAGEQQKKIESFDRDIFNFLMQHSWNGNIRELQNFIERLVTCAPKEKIMLTRALLPQKLQLEMREKLADLPTAQFSIKEAVADYEKQLYLQALQDHDWNQSQTARYLSLSERMLRYNMQRLGILKPGDE